MAIPKVFVRSAHNYDRREASDKAASLTPYSGEMRTQQHQKDEADINVIMAKFGQTGLVPANVRLPVPEDYEGIFDFQTAMNAVVEAKESFMALPAEIRSKFSNNPQEYMKFCTAKNKDGSLKNLAEMRELGLAKPEVIEPPVVPMKVEVVNPVVPKPA